MSRIKIPDAGGATMIGADVGEFIQPCFPMSETELKDLFKNMPNYKFRDDDVMLLTFPKTGTNWLYEILHMILNRSSEYTEDTKMDTMMESRLVADIDTVKSPRIMNIHYPYEYLPIKGLQEKQIKTILCLRNPKDSAVSYYNHMISIKLYEYDGKWCNWLPTCMDGKLEYGKYTDYLKGFETAIKQGVGFPLHVMYFEDLKSNGLEELDKLLKFLKIDLDTELRKDIIHKCRFDQMVNKNWDATNFMFHEAKEFTTKGFMRKGSVGNWKTWFTVAQNEAFDKQWNSEMEGYSMFKFKYAL
ncbi:Sulfotransferase [Mactra antiquata]